MALRPPSPNQNADRPSDAPAQTDAGSGNAITALGRLEPGGEVFCVAPPSSTGLSSVIKRWMVKQGDRVKSNQVIAVMDTYDRLLAAGIEAEARVREAQTQLAQVQAGSAKQSDIGAQQAQMGARQAEIGTRQAELARRQAALDNAEWEYKRYQQLLKDGAISEQEVKKRELALQTAQEAVRQGDLEIKQAIREFEQSREQRGSLLEVRPVDVQQAQAQVQVAVANLQKAKAELETAAVRSPIEGQVLKIYAKEGEQISSVQGSGSGSRQCSGIAELGQTNQMYAVAEVAESDIARVRLRQRATITSTSSVNPPFEGSIAGVVDQVGLQVRKNDVLNTDPVQDTDTRVVEVKVRLETSQAVAKLTNLKVLVRIEP